MRDISFRGKRVDNEQWVEGSLVNNIFFRAESNRPIPYIIDPYEYEEYNCMEDIGDLAVEVAPETIGQFTGLTDKNGVKIFEGDIVAFTAELWEPHYYQGFVYFCDGAFWVDCGKDNDDNDVLFSIGHALLADKNIQVIGNIHNNPELLT